MRAAVRYQYCKPDDLTIARLPIPTPADREILVKVKATTVSWSDVGVLTGKPYAIRLFTGLQKPQRVITGTDFAGIVVARGEGVTEFQIGDQVYGFHDEGLGSHAEYIAVPLSKSVLKKPPHITFEQAAASLEGAHYAFSFLDKFRLEQGQSVLVNGGTGAIGNAAVQFLKYYNMQITVTCEPAFAGLMTSLGANRVIDFTSEDFTTLEPQFQYVFDAVGKSSFGKCKRLLTKGGIYISSELGPYWQNIWFAMLSPVLPGKKVKFPLPLSIHRSHAFINELLEKGKFSPLIDRRFPLEEIREAFRYVQSGQKKGNVLICYE